MTTFLAYLVFYLIGAFPTGLIMASLKDVNITGLGSGNVGATNVARVLGKRAGIVTLLVDCAKGLLAILLAHVFSADSTLPIWAGTCAVFGHCISVPPLLKGGKGVATSLGVFFYLSPIAATIGLLTFAVTFYFSKIVSLGSLIAAAVIPVVVLLMDYDTTTTAAACLISLLVFFRHKENLYRLAHGHESKFNL